MHGRWLKAILQRRLVCIIREAHHPRGSVVAKRVQVRGRVKVGVSAPLCQPVKEKPTQPDPSDHHACRVRYRPDRHHRVE